MNPFIRAYCPGNKLDKGFKVCYNYDKISHFSCPDGR